MQNNHNHNNEWEGNTNHTEQIVTKISLFDHDNGIIDHYNTEMMEDSRSNEIS
mgnify:FL=1